MNEGNKRESSEKYKKQRKKDRTIEMDENVCYT